MLAIDIIPLYRQRLRVDVTVTRNRAFGIYSRSRDRYKMAPPRGLEPPYHARQACVLAAERRRCIMRLLSTP